MQQDHPFHVAFGKWLRKIVPNDCPVILDVACGGDQLVPLFSRQIKSHVDRRCNVDALVIGMNKTVRCIFEVEESSLDQTTLFGKLGTAAAAEYYIHDRSRNVPVPIEAATFVQVVKTSSLPAGTAKPGQFKEIERINQARLDRERITAITTYRLL